MHGSPMIINNETLCSYICGFGCDYFSLWVCAGYTICSFKVCVVQGLMEVHIGYFPVLEK